MPANVVKDTFRSPRAYKDYDHRRKPVPKYLEDSLRNSFATNQLLIPFLNKFYCGFFPKSLAFKIRQCCTVGEKNSGKTTWGSIYKGIIPSEHIASVSREGQFALSMLTEDTQLCIMDEWSTEKLTSDAIKSTLQGTRFG